MTKPDLTGLPGANRIERGLADLREGRLSPEALLIAIAATRLRDLGLPVPPSSELPEEPDLTLYATLGETMTGSDEDSYYRYNALRSELDSFISALEARRGRAARGVGAADS